MSITTDRPADDSDKASVAVLDASSHLGFGLRQVPHVNRQEYQVLDVSEDGYVSPHVPTLQWILAFQGVRPDDPAWRGPVHDRRTLLVPVCPCVLCLTEVPCNDDSL